MSSLNPNAKSYVPLSRRETAEENQYSNLNAKDHQSGNENSTGLDTTENHQNKGSGTSSGIGILPTTKDSAKMADTVNDSFGSSSHNPCEITDRQALNEDFDMDLAYLQMTFPGTSDECISYVYLANGGDLETSIDLLSQLELSDVDPLGSVPDSLKTVDLLEHASSSSEAAFLKLKKVAVEDGSSSSSAAAAAAE